MKDKNIIPKDRVQAMIDKVKSLRYEVCEIAGKRMGPNTQGECPGEACPLNELCMALLPVWCKLTIMESRPLEGEKT